MDLKLFGTVFATVFLAELGDKTQLATLLYASDERHSRTTVFLGASAALVVCAALGVLGGVLMRGWLNPRVLSALAGASFMLLGAWTLWRAWRGEPAG
ncbi:MAG: TMEM165/GDT1 family protein [Planctomycetes bacterium]|nr:TMEM165/GDT1 family protein [Planctomycetota bacterium]